MRIYSNTSSIPPGHTPPHRALIYHAKIGTTRMKVEKGHMVIASSGWESSWALHIPLPFKRTESQDYGRVKIRGWAVFKIATFQSEEGYPRRWMFGLCVPRPDPVAFEKPNNL